MRCPHHDVFSVPHTPSSEAHAHPIAHTAIARFGTENTRAVHRIPVSQCHTRPTFPALINEVGGGEQRHGQRQTYRDRDRETHTATETETHTR
eukprot:1718846-Rhodomonas_salina.2